MIDCGCENSNNASITLHRSITPNQNPVELPHNAQSLLPSLITESQEQRSVALSTMYSESNGSEGSQLSGCCYVAVLGMAGSGKTRFIADLLEHDDLIDDCGLTGGE